VSARQAKRHDDPPFVGAVIIAGNASQSAVFRATAFRPGAAGHFFLNVNNAAFGDVFLLADIQRTLRGAHLNSTPLIFGGDIA
jgi:hypothetical protein